MSEGLHFPAGSMLWVFRAVEFDQHGDPVLPDPLRPNVDIVDGYLRSHQIGPCAIGKSWAGRNVEDGERRTNRVSVTSTNTDDDVRGRDRIELPNGRIVNISGDPMVPRNPFTGWTPGLRFTLEEVV
ncbi:hypothetical protein [Rhodococcus rhodochrous]|uniref:hypothetical protein n=1 Tax=Rhodococcus rhodochrous TaxID=1829 RepID=UPI00177FBBFD|nr:hypothetical protein [Rhodococcus rhodochrous]